MVERSKGKGREDGGVKEKAKRLGRKDDEITANLYFPPKERGAAGGYSSGILRISSKL